MFCFGYNNSFWWICMFYLPISFRVSSETLKEMGEIIQYMCTEKEQKTTKRDQWAQLLACIPSTCITPSRGHGQRPAPPMHFGLGETLDDSAHCAGVLAWNIQGVKLLTLLSKSIWLNNLSNTISNISCTKSQNLNVSRLILQLSLLNPLKPDVKSRMKM